MVRMPSVNPAISRAEKTELIAEGWVATGYQTASKRMAKTDGKRIAEGLIY